MNVSIKVSELRSIVKFPPGSRGHATPLFRPTLDVFYECENIQRRQSTNLRLSSVQEEYVVHDDQI